MLKNIKYVLNNENAGPNLEHLIAIGVSLAMVCAARFFASGDSKAYSYAPYTESGKSSVYTWIRRIVKSEGIMVGRKTG